LGSLTLAVSCMPWNNSTTIRWLDGHPIIDQTHEIQSLAKELDYTCALPDKFVVGAYLPKNLPREGILLLL
jgi:hypothetical protein